MKQPGKLFRLPVFISFFLVTVFCGGFYSPVLAGGWVFKVQPAETLDLNPNTTQWVTINGHLIAVTLLEGKIAIFEHKDDSREWRMNQEFGPAGILVSAFQLKDINHDEHPEIIAGTNDPGFIYIYKYNDGQWDLHNYGKYVWSDITFITVGNFGGIQGNDILVQNQEGFLFLLKITDNSLDLVWKSPNVWRPISSGFVRDIDGDSSDELIVVYKTGGIGVLKMENNSIVSVWENYLWGKVLAVTAGDWDNDQKTEIMISTSQKVIYALGWSEGKGYQFEDQWSQLNSTIEKFLFLNSAGESELIAADTAGKLHQFNYNRKNRNWVEDFVCATGRISQIVTADSNQVLLWGLNRKMILVDLYLTKEIQARYLDDLYQLTPPPMNNGGVLYVSPKALQAIPGLNLTFKSDKSSFTIIRDNKTLQVIKKTLAIKVNGEEIALPEEPLIADGELQLSLSSYQTLLNLNLNFNFESKIISIKDGNTTAEE